LLHGATWLAREKWQGGVFFRAARGIVRRVGHKGRQKMKMVDNASSAWRWFSMQAMTVALAIQGAIVGMPDDMKARIPDNLMEALAIVALALGMVGRLVKQEVKE
jgi:hypothetical protein